MRIPGSVNRRGSNALAISSCATPRPSSDRPGQQALVLDPARGFATASRSPGGSTSPARRTRRSTRRLQRLAEPERDAWLEALWRGADTLLLAGGGRARALFEAAIEHARGEGCDAAGSTSMAPTAGRRRPMSYRTRPRVGRRSAKTASGTNGRTRVTRVAGVRVLWNDRYLGRGIDSSRGGYP